MASWGEGDQSPGWVDPAYVRDTFVEDVGAVEIIDGCLLRITFIVKRDFSGGDTERLVVARLVMALHKVPQQAQRIVSAAAGLPFMTDVAPDIVPN